MSIENQRRKHTAQATVQLATRLSVQSREQLADICAREQITIRDLLESAIDERWQRSSEGQTMLDIFETAGEKNIA